MASEFPERELSDAERAYNDMERKILDDEQTFTDHVWDSLVNDDRFFKLIRDTLEQHDRYSHTGSYYYEVKTAIGARLLSMVALAKDAACTRAAEKAG